MNNDYRLLVTKIPCEAALCMDCTIDKRIALRWPLMVLLKQYTAYCVSVSAMEILFNLGIPAK